MPDITVGDLVEHVFRFQVRKPQETKVFFPNDAEDRNDPYIFVKEKETLLVEKEEDEYYILRPLTKATDNCPGRSYYSDGSFKLPKTYVNNYTRVLNVNHKTAV